MIDFLLSGYRERVLTKDRLRIAKIVSHKFHISEKKALKIVTYYELPDSPKRNRQEETQS